MSASPLAAGFTSADWFQLLYPVFWFFVGVLVDHLARRRSAPVEPATAAPVHVAQIIDAPILSPPARRSRGRRGRSSDGDGGAWIFGGALAVLGLGWLYLHARGLTLAAAGAPLAIALGLVVGRVHRGIRSRRLGSDWWTAIAAWLVLSLLAVACGFVLLHPLASPDAYDALFDGFRREGIGRADLFDPTFMFISYQAIGALFLVAGTMLLLFVVCAVLAKESLLAGKPATRARRSLAHGARRRGTVRLSLGIVAVLLGTSFAFSSGYAHAWIDPAAPRHARILAPSATLRARTLTVDFVTDRASRVRLTVQRRFGSPPLHTSELRLAPGRHRPTRRMPGRVRRVFVTLTPLDGRGEPGTRRHVTALRVSA